MKRVCLAGAAGMLVAMALPAEAAITSLGWGGVGGKGVDLFVLTNARGMEAKITNYGAVITSVRVPGRDGKLTNVVQGFDRLEDYTSPGYGGRYGAIIGRYAHRIQDNTFQLARRTHPIAPDPHILK